MGSHQSLGAKKNHAGKYIHHLLNTIVTSTGAVIRKATPFETVIRKLTTPLAASATSARG
jgi:hypothetical protein